MKIFQINLKRFFILALLGLTVCFSTVAGRAQSSPIDSSFNPLPSKPGGDGRFVKQPDGKILVFGSFQIVNGLLKNQIARFNADGSLDNTFNCDACTFYVESALLQPDGKIIVAGAEYTDASSNAVVLRLNPDGSRDANFASPFASVGFPTSQSASVPAIQSDGKILIVLLTTSAGNSSYTLYRLNPNGAFDTGFTAPPIGGGRLVRQIPVKILTLPDNRILVASNTYSAMSFSPSLLRFNANGTCDETFESPNFTPTANTYPTGTLIGDMELLADGGLIIVGKFDGVNGISRVNIVKLQPAGNVDLNFNPPNAFQNFEPVNGVEVYSNGKILVGTGVVSNPIGTSGTTNRFIQFNPDGSLDNSFVSPPNLLLIKQFEIDEANSALVFGTFTANGVSSDGFVRLNQNGAINSYFDSILGIGASITTLAVQPDGKILLAGDFLVVNGAARKTLARVNSDGSLDSTFNFGGITSETITKIRVQADGKILLAGSFTVNNTSNLGLARLNPDGSVDTTFMPLVSGVSDIAIQSNGKIIIGGGFNSVNGQSRIGLARLNSDGTTDASFNPLFASSTNIRSVVVQPDGKIVVGGAFSAVNGFARSNLVRLNADGRSILLSTPEVLPSSTKSYSKQTENF